MDEQFKKFYAESRKFLEDMKDKCLHPDNKNTHHLDAMRYVSANVDNGGWPERDALPTGDPIGDVDESKSLAKSMIDSLTNIEFKDEYIRDFLKKHRATCDCGAKHTRNPNIHSHWCKVNE